MSAKKRESMISPEIALFFHSIDWRNGIFAFCPPSNLEVVRLGRRNIYHIDCLPDTVIFYQDLPTSSNRPSSPSKSEKPWWMPVNIHTLDVPSQSLGENKLVTLAHWNPWFMTLTPSILVSVAVISSHSTNPPCTHSKRWTCRAKRFLSNVRHTSTQPIIE